MLDYLQDREMPPSDEAVYERRMLRVSLLDSGREVRAVAFVADRTHASYCRPEAAAAAAAIAAGLGQMGPNREYLLNTVAHLRAMGVRDAGLDRIAALLPPGLNRRFSRRFVHSAGRDRGRPEAVISPRKPRAAEPRRLRSHSAKTKLYTVF